MSSPARRRLFGAIAAGFVLSCAFHVAALLDPSLAGGSPPWRHALFAVLNALTAAGLVRRPRGFAAAFALLTAQQLASHGRDLVLAWRAEHRVDLASGLVVVTMPVVLALLLTEDKSG